MADLRSLKKSILVMEEDELLQHILDMRESRRTPKLDPKKEAKKKGKKTAKRKASKRKPKKPVDVAALASQMTDAKKQELMMALLKQFKG
jgi:hypothetical protein